MLDIQSTENCRTVCHRFWLRLTLISNFRTSAPKKLNDIDLSSNGLTNAFEGAKGKFLSANIGNKEHHQTCLCISQFQVLPSFPRATLRQFFLSNSSGSGFPGTLNPISTGLFYLVVALEGSFPPPPSSIKFDPDILEH